MNPIKKIKPYARKIIFESRIILLKFFTLFKILLLRFYSPFKKYKVYDSVIVSSETRSGSTWLMEMLSSAPGTIINWEPLHELKGVVPKSLKWGERPYIPEDSEDKAAIALMRKILGFKIFSKNSIRYCEVKDIITSKRVLTKMVRSSLLLPFIAKNFDLKHKPIYLIRHPVAVSKSQIRNIEDDQYDIQSFQIPDTLNNERYKENFSYITQLKSILERRVALWCIHNMEIINHPQNGNKWITVHYENLLMDTESELNRISKEIDLDLNMSDIKFERPSKTDFYQELKRDREAQLSKWQNGLSKDDLRNIQNIFDHYHLKLYSAYEIYPQNNS